MDITYVREGNTKLTPLVPLVPIQAALLTYRLLRQISFKHTVQIWMAWTCQADRIDNEDRLYNLFVLIAQPHVGQRPGRIEPRALKRRHKPHPLLTQIQVVAQEKIRIHGHPKKRK